MNNKYSPFKIFKQTSKMESLVRGEITAPVAIRLKPCNLCPHRCSWCVYNPEFAGMHETCNRTDFIPIGKIKEILEDLKEMGVKVLILSGGGEPLAHPNASEMLDAINASGLDWAVITNGQYILRHVSKLRYAKWVRVSADYWDAESFSRSRGLDGRRLQEILDGVKALSDTDCEVGVNYVVSQESHVGILKATSIFKDSGVSNIRFSPVWVGDFSKYHSNFAWVADHVIILAWLTYDDDDFKIYNGYKLDVNEIRSFNFCPWQQITPVIAADQSLYRCHNTAYTKHGLLGSLQNQRFKDLWFSKEVKDSMLSFDPSKNCNHQCSSENRIQIINQYLESSNDAFV